MLETAGSTGRFEHLSGAKTNSIVDIREELCEPKPAERGKFKRFIVNGRLFRNNLLQKIIRTSNRLLGSYYSGLVRGTGLVRSGVTE